MYICWGLICFVSNFYLVMSSLLERTPPPVKAAKPERAVRSVILPPGRPVFGAKKLVKGCDCDDGAAAEGERDCNVLSECRILQKLQFAACQLR